MECQDEKFIFYDFYSTQSLSCFGQPLAKAISPLNFPGFLITFSPWRPSLASASSSPLTTGRPWCKRRWPRCWPRPGGILKFWWWMTPPRDGTAEALAAFGSRIRLLRSPARLGVAAARNLGISAARGQWLAFLDSDDLWMPEKLARQMAYLAGLPELVLCQTEETWERRGLKVNQPRSHRKIGGWIFFPSLERCLVSPSAVILHRTVFEKHGGFDENLPAAEDYDLWLRLSWRYQIGLLPEALVIRRGGRDGPALGPMGPGPFSHPGPPQTPGGPGAAGPEALAARRTLAAQMRHLRPGLRKAAQAGGSRGLPGLGETGGRRGANP